MGLPMQWHGDQAASLRGISKKEQRVSVKCEQRNEPGIGVDQKEFLFKDRMSVFAKFSSLHLVSHRPPFQNLGESGPIN